jgi:predicted aspartyl protease
MAIIFLKVKVINPEHPKKVKECEFLVDSGAVYSVVPHKVLKALGIRPTSSQEFILANGEIVKRPTTIEALGMILDPIRRELKPLPMVLM